MDSRANDLPPGLQQDALARVRAAGGVGLALGNFQNSNGHDDGYFGATQGNPQHVTGWARHNHHALDASGFRGYTPPAIYGPEVFPTDEFHRINGYSNDFYANGSNFNQPQFVTDDVSIPNFINVHGNAPHLGMSANGSSFAQLQSINNGVYTPATITEHGNDSQRSFNTNGSNFTQPQLHLDGVFTPTISTLPATANDQGLFIGGAFANHNGVNDSSPTINAHGFNHGNNPLPTMGAYSSNNDNNPMLATGAYSSNYGNNLMLATAAYSYNDDDYPLPPWNGIYGSSLMTPPQIADGAFTPTGSAPVAATPFVSPMDPAPAGPPVAALGARHACPDCEKTYSRRSDLKRHVAKHRPGPRPYSCPSTGCSYKGSKGFTRKDKMRDHVKNMHPEIDVRSL